MLVHRLAKTASTLASLRKMAGLSGIRRGLKQVTNTASSVVNNPFVRNPGKTIVGIGAAVGGANQVAKNMHGFDPAVHNQLAGPVASPPSGGQ